MITHNLSFSNLSVTLYTFAGANVQVGATSVEVGSKIRNLGLTFKL